LSLPPKTFETMMVPMSPEQALLYRTVMEVVLQEDEDLTSAFTRRAAYLKAILHLKQICNHPEVFYGDQTESEVIAALETEDGRISHKMRQVVRAKLRTDTRRRSRLASDDIVARSGKLSVLRDLLTALKEQSSGILIFTQFRATAALLRSFLRTLCDPEWADVPFLHGGLSSQERQWLVDDFSRRSEVVLANRRKGLEEVSPILILSLKAGGTGLNLTAADRVIHFDRWWNPAVEDQATDRAHRFGQTKPVFVYNLTTQGSIESSISKIFRDKRSLSLDFLGGAAASEIGEYLQNNQGFLDLVDPDHIFQSRADGLSPEDLSLWDPH
jgi:SNF2 family DNA or RNA helicase